MKQTALDLNFSLKKTRKCEFLEQMNQVVRFRACLDVVKAGGMTVPQIHELFPNLADQGATQGTRLSGGEQQMLAIGRILRTGANMILLDEPTEGLAPALIAQIGVAIRALKRLGYGSLLTLGVELILGKRLAVAP